MRQTRPVNRLSAVRARVRARASLPGEVYVLGLIAFCVAVGFGVLVPVLPVFARSFGVGNLQVGAVISAFALMRLVSSPVCGKLINLWGERIVMATGIFIVAISSGLAGISQSYVQLLVLRGVGGIGSAAGDDRCTRFDQHGCDPSPDPTGSAGHQGDPSREVHGQRHAARLPSKR